MVIAVGIFFPATDEKTAFSSVPSGIRARKLLFSQCFSLYLETVINTQFLFEIKHVDKVKLYISLWVSVLILSTDMYHRANPSVRRCSFLHESCLSSLHYSRGEEIVKPIVRRRWEKGNHEVTPPRVGGGRYGWTTTDAVRRVERERYASTAVPIILSIGRAGPSTSAVEATPDVRVCSVYKRRRGRILGWRHNLVVGAYSLVCVRWGLDIFIRFYFYVCSSLVRLEFFHYHPIPSGQDPDHWKSNALRTLVLVPLPLPPHRCCLSCFPIPCV